VRNSDLSDHCIIRQWGLSPGLRSLPFFGSRNRRIAGLEGPFSFAAARSAGRRMTIEIRLFELYLLIVGVLYVSVRKGRCSNWKTLII
jgi:hypothetical protein